MGHPQKYRPDIDGLRAVAVIGVLIYHGFPELLPGGYVGVDVFFVISGFLISTLLFQQQEKGKINLVDFFARRIKRLFPGLLLVVFTTLTVGWLLLMPSEFKQLTKNTVAGLFYFANFFYWQEAGYFNATAETKPLLHLWSLSIEEQFYLVYPLLLIFIARFRLKLIFLLGSLFSLSFVCSWIMTSMRPSFAFYSPITRFWELLAGSLLAYFVLYAPKKLESLPQNIAHPMSFLGLGFILAGYFLLTANSFFPGVSALLPVLGAVFILLAGEEAFINQKILSSKILVFVGLISYPIYLWHWPILVYLRYSAGEAITSFQIMTALAFSAVLAWLTVVILERRLRHGENAIVFRIAAFAGACGIASLLGWTGYWTPKASRWPAAISVDQASKDWNFPGTSRAEKYGSQTLRHLGSGSEKVLFIGDSHIEQYLPRVENLMNSKEAPTMGAIFSTAPGCPPLPKVKRDLHVTDCARAFLESLERAKQDDVKTVVFGSAWNFYFQSQRAYVEIQGKKEFLELNSASAKLALSEFTKVIEELVSSNKKVFVVSGMPQGEEFAPLKMIKRSIFGLEFNPGQGLSRKDFDARFEPLLKSVRTAALAGGARIIEPTDSLCDENYCPSVDGLVPRYKDSGHLRASYVSENARYLDVVFGQSQESTGK